MNLMISETTFFGKKILPPHEDRILTSSGHTVFCDR